MATVVLTTNSMSTRWKIWCELISTLRMKSLMRLASWRTVQRRKALGRELVKKLKEVIPRQNFQVALQAAIGARFIAREDLSAYRKDVTTGLYGGDVSRKKKVLAKQAKGKKRMKRFGKVDIPTEAFTVMLKRD